MIYIIRHGQTENNKAKLLQGRTDIPLNKDGIRQAEAAAKWFCDQQIRIDSVYSSPLIRAVETAKIIALEAPLFIEDRLIEMDYGPYEGMDLTNPAPEVRVFFSDFVHNPVPQGMEPLSSVTARLGEFLEEIREQAEGQIILLSTHALAMKGALEYLTPDSHGSYWSKFIGNCAVYAIPIKDYRYGIVDVDRRPCLDGGCSCKIPYRWALDQGYEKIVVVRTREPEYRKTVSKKKRRIHAYRKYPAFERSLAKSSRNYNHQCDEIQKLEKKRRIFVIAPSQKVTVSRLEGDM